MDTLTEQRHEHAHDACCGGHGAAAAPPAVSSGTPFRTATMDCAAEESEIRAALKDIAG